MPVLQGSGVVGPLPLVQLPRTTREWLHRTGAFPVRLFAVLYGLSWG
jgi:hypothetical protein